MTKLVPGKMYTHMEVANARTRGQIVGWVQAGAVAIAGLFVLKLVGWIPALLVIGVVGVIAVKLLFGKKRGTGA